MNIITPNPKLTVASFDAALNDPQNSIYNTFAKYGAGTLAERLIARTPIMHILHADGAAPAGMLTRADAIETVPGTNTTIDGQPLSEIWTELQVALALFNAHASQYVSALTFRVVRPTEKIAVPHSPGMQEATELGRPSKVRTQLISRAFPLDHKDLGAGYTQEYLDDATAEQILAVAALIRSAWVQEQQETVLDALLGNANYTDPDGLFIRRLYNADGEVPQSVKRWTFDGTHNHYMTADTPGSPDEDDLEQMADNLIHHGFREFGGQDVSFVLHVRREDLADIREFDGWVPAQTGSAPVIIDGNVVGRTRDAATPSGLNVEGWIGDWTVVQDNNLPMGYWVGIVEDSTPFSRRNVVGLRQHENPSARGLRLVEGGRQNYPLIDSVYDGYLGAGVGQRGAAVVMDVDNQSYVPPNLVGMN